MNQMTGAHRMTEPPRTLPELAASLVAKVGELTEAVKGLATRLKRNERIVHLIAGIVVFDIVLTAVVTAVVYSQYQTNQKLNDTRAAVLCPLYGVIAGAYAPESRAAGADRDRYIAGYQLIKEAYARLDCPTAPLPPRVIGSAPPR